MITSAELQSLVEFRGYGNLDAPLWFLGMEGSLGPRPEMDNWTPERELSIRAQWSPVIDVRDAHVQLRDQYWERRNYSQVWRFMAQLARGLLHDSTDWRDTNLAHGYVIEHLGRAAGETFLGEIMPLPASGMTHWPYVSIFTDREAYWQEVWPKRQRLWKELIRTRQPRYVVAYGKGYWDSYREIFGNDGWVSVIHNRIMKKAYLDTTNVYLIPFMGQGALRKDDLQAILHSENKNFSQR